MSDGAGAGGRASEIRIFRSGLLSEGCPWLTHGFSGRAGGFSRAPFDSLNLGLHVGDRPERVGENRAGWLAALGAGDLDQMVAAAQVHGGEARWVTAGDAGSGARSPETSIAGADGLATAEPGLALMLLFADCVPILLADPDHRAFAVIHAGWRGTAAGVAARSVSLMRESIGSDPTRLLAWIAPAIGSCCYEVDSGVAEAVARSCGREVGDPAVFRTGISTGAGKYYPDLKVANRLQLEAVGLGTQNIEVAGECTCCNPEWFFSYRREGKTGRMALSAAIEPAEVAVG